jgi:hypothetical protein
VSTARTQVNAPVAKVAAQADRKAPASGTFASDSLAKGYDPNWAPPGVVPVLLIALVVFVVVRPNLLRKIFVGVELPKLDLSEFRAANVEEEKEFASSPPPRWNVAEPVRSAPPPGPVVFGRRK